MDMSLRDLCSRVRIPRPITDRKALCEILDMERGFSSPTWYFNGYKRERIRLLGLACFSSTSVWG